MSKEDDHHEVDKKEKFRTPPLVQQPHFAYQQQYYYYYQTPVYPSGMAASPPPNAPSYNSEMNLMSPLQFNYLPASPSQNYNPYGQQTYGYQYSPKVSTTTHILQRNMEMGYTVKKLIKDG